MAAKSSESLMDKAYHFMDSFHNVEPERAPSKIGCSLTLLMGPVVLIYVIIWIVNHEMQPPVESLVIDWSVAKGPYLMKVQCVEANCWMYLSGCTSASSGQCIALSSGQEQEIEMCYSNAAREGLHIWWDAATGADPTAAGVKIFSEALGMPMSQIIEPGRSSMTYVKTNNLTEPEGSYGRLRREWFVMYLSSQALAPTHTGCQSSISNTTEAAQVVMRPEFYDKQVEKTELWVSIIGEAGGAFSLAQTAFFALYLLLWHCEYGRQRVEEKMHKMAEDRAATVAGAPPEPIKVAAQDSFTIDVERAQL